MLLVRIVGRRWFRPLPHPPCTRSRSTFPREYGPRPSPPNRRRSRTGPTMVALGMTTTRSPMRTGPSVASITTPARITDLAPTTTRAASTTCTPSCNVASLETPRAAPRSKSSRMHTALCSISCHGNASRRASGRSTRRSRCVSTMRASSGRGRGVGRCFGRRADARLEQRARGHDRGIGHLRAQIRRELGRGRFSDVRRDDASALDRDAVLGQAREERVALARETQPARVDEERLGVERRVHGDIGRGQSEHVREVVAANQMNARRRIAVDPARTQRSRADAQVEHRLCQRQRKEVDEAGVLEDADRAGHEKPRGATCSNARAGCAGGSPFVRLQEDDSKDGGVDGDRTRDLLTASQVLSQLSYNPGAFYHSRRPRAVKRKVWTSARECDT